MFFDNLPLEITCFKCGKQIKETVKWLKAESQKCPFCGTLIDTTEFRRGMASEPPGQPWEYQDKDSALITVVDRQ